MRRLLVTLIALAATWALPAVASASSGLPPIQHVFTIVLENESASTTFGPGSPAPYLASTLRSQGAFLPKYYGIGHNSLDNYIAMISGQAPNMQTRNDCPVFSDFVGTIQSNGQAAGTGCVYPAAVQTLPGQLTSAGKTWRSYDEDMGANPSRESATCGHPALNGPDNTETATATDQYATRHDPFVYFHSIIDNQALCNSHVVNLDQLPHDLASASTTPNYAFITPDLCEDGHDAPCANGDPGGLAQVNTFLQKWVPMITGSPAFKQQNGLLIVTFDEAATSGPAADASSCCGEIPGPAADMAPNPGGSGPGGGVVGAVMLSPCIAPGTVTQTPYNHYTMLRSVEDIFGLGRIGYANLPGESSFGSDIFTRACAPAPQAKVTAPALASSRATTSSIPVRWSGSDGSGAGIANYTVTVAQAGKSGSRTLAAGTKATSLTFHGKAGKTYRFSVEATDLAGAHSAAATATTVVPSGAKPHGGHYHGRWQVKHVKGAWEGKAISCSSASCSFTLTYTGRAIAIIGERGPTGGSARVSGGKSRTINLHAKKRTTRQVIYRTQGKDGRHKLTLKVKRGTVALEGFAITP
ncbi:MAG TPA: alkaline phosphatase family protein [Solirubrobacteraceae bacterium]